MKFPANMVLAVALVLLTACGEEPTVAKPDPQELTREAIGYYCNMIVADHQGPKAQILLKGRAEPIWFSSVRDAVAFTLLPEEPKSIAAIYVNDMARASWDSPEPGTWIEASGASYVIHSDRRGGMGAQEAVPFATAEAARNFTARHGGEVVAYADLPSDYILGSAESDAESSGHDHGGQQAQDGHATH